MHQYNYVAKQISSAKDYVTWADGLMIENNKLIIV